MDGVELVDINDDCDDGAFCSGMGQVVGWDICHGWEKLGGLSAGEFWEKSLNLDLYYKGGGRWGQIGVKYQDSSCWIPGLFWSMGDKLDNC